jgi:putative ABC transport system permease protein
VIGIAGVVAVPIAVLSMTTGFRRTLTAGAQPDRAIALTRGAEAEYFSGLTLDNVRDIAAAPGVARNATGELALSAETVALVPVVRSSDGADAFVTLRGVSPDVLEVRREMKLVAGRLMKPGLREVLAGRAARAQFANLRIGESVRLGDGDWTVVGHFTSDESALEPSLLVDAQTMQSAYRLKAFNSVTVRLTAPDAFTRFKDAIASTPGLVAEARREVEFVQSASQPLNRMLNFAAYAIGGIMAIGALFGALNTMYTAVSTRSVEIATLRALGFGSGAVVTSVIVEALLLALCGALLGVLLVYVGLDGRVVSSIGDTVGNNPQLVYSLSVTPDLVATGVAIACVIGVGGGLFPALRAAHMPVATALRAK